MATTFTDRRPFPIHDLPNEIVDNVLTLSIPKELTDPAPGSGRTFRAFLERTGVRDYPRLLNPVCRKWRTLVHRNATIWSYVFVGAVKSDGYGYFPEYYDEPLTLSKDKPLSLVCIVGNMSISDVLSSPLFAPHASRVRMLCVHVLGFDYTDPVFPLFEKIATPALEVLRIYDTEDVDESWGNYREWRGILYSPPRLSELSLAGFRRGLDSFALTHVGKKAGIDWSRLTVLRLPNIPCRASDLLFVVSTNMQLQVFQCTVFGHPEDEELCPAEFSEPLSDSEDDFSDGEDEADYTEEDRQDAAARRLRRDSRPERRREYQAMMGPHLLPDLSELHLEVAHHPDYEPDVSWRRRGRNVDERSGMAIFLEGLNTPALSTLAISTTNGLVHDTLDSDIEDHEDALDDQEHGTGAFVLAPLLSDLIERSQCTIRYLSLSRLFVSLPELLGIIELCQHLRSLRLNRPLRFMRGSLLDGLAARNGRLRAPELRRLVIESRTQTMFTGIKTSDILYMIDTRWPPGWSDTEVAYVKVVHCPSAEYDPRRKHSKDALEATTRAWLASTRARKDIKVTITELPRSRAWVSSVRLGV
ncbi:uncharacterized protein SCHCODRAFT_02638572 [Schizophyllum commune H4-8]|uniref:uncharacterized protein n=1 Tax=Schizophyllum commune (strain H4-8 / FGSC 9210) TaxID=578458 RepID=UPI0021601710|nr:uncharacterized protein SCHCODRAFT_02638572 [Schizophyllum commune H4-8]KAI5887638.1 hypothetical protein SCHCODRAFT_02638572 [Schizophyllum commune H4-8]